ncbi:hypothetical protein ACWDTI_24275 [Gordonia sp. NPDC003424]
MTTSSPTAIPLTRNTRIGFVLAILAALPNLVVIPTPDGEPGPPLGVSIGVAVVAAITIVAAIMGWRTHRTWAIRLAVGGSALLVLANVPAFFVAGIPVGWQVACGLLLIVGVAAIILMLYRPTRVSEDVPAVGM